MDRKQVLMLFGGESSEHDVSVSSARNVYAAIDDDLYEIYLGYIDTYGKWWLLNGFDEQINTRDASQLLPVLGGHGFTTMPTGKAIKPDVILPILHGRNGEDGTVQGLAQLLHIPIVGCETAASSIGMDKVASKEIATAHGVQVVPYVVHRAGEEAPNYNELTTKLGSPVFVKPSRAGSSVGVSKAHNETELSAALKTAHEHDTVVLIEQAVTARELETGILGTPPHHQVSGVGEIVPGEDFYSYDDKYAGGSKAQVVLPADISDEVKQRVQEAAKTVYQAIGCSGLSRVDFFLAEDGTVYFNEINTLPGFTSISMYPKLWREEGIGYPELIKRLIDDALSRNVANR